MERNILVACVVLLVLDLYSEVVLASPRYHSPVDSGKGKEDESRSTHLLFSPRLGRKKRNLKDDSFIPSEQELADLWELLESSPAAVVTINGNDKFVCRNIQGTYLQLHQLGRNMEELPGNGKWLQDSLPIEIEERSPVFDPRLGKRLSPYSPRLGREA
ncbi:hypothetical protein NQ315_015015 [Exocentrus adspersus]|uniref:Uncharacterized protein n=1 Tax=Exocentrus adspersus TaxID=1586481 RepID=A0AAV8VXL0_9CUCU|nr:hypothetical protein NQ315_015015 [Exocentrus adspersus]